jgi:hypothetical protein
VLAIELARARARRSVADPLAPGVALAPGVVPLASDRAALAALEVVERHLFELALVPHVGLVDDRPTLPALPSIPGEPVFLLFRARGGHATLEEIHPALFRALDGLARAAAQAPLDRDGATAALTGLGLPTSRPELLLDQLAADGLVRAPG